MQAAKLGTLVRVPVGQGSCMRLCESPRIRGGGAGGSAWEECGATSPHCSLPQLVWPNAALSLDAPGSGNVPDDVCQGPWLLPPL